MTPTTVGLDLAKNVSHVRVTEVPGHTRDSEKHARRALLPFLEVLPACLIGIETCATAHNRARQLQRPVHESVLFRPATSNPLCGAGYRMMQQVLLPSAKQ